MNRNTMVGFFLAAAVAAPDGAFAELNGDFGVLRSNVHSGVFDSIVPAAAVPVRATRKRASAPRSGLSAADEALAARSARYLGASPALVRLAIAKSRKYGVEPCLVLAVIMKESTFNPNARSEADARGLMQVQPATARWIDEERMREQGIPVRSQPAPNLYNPSINLDRGIGYLRFLQHRYGTTHHALAAYYAGPGYVSRRRAIPSYTRGYVNGVTGTWTKLQRVR